MPCLLNDKLSLWAARSVEPLRGSAERRNLEIPAGTQQLAHDLFGVNRAVARGQGGDLLLHLVLVQLVLELAHAGTKLFVLAPTKKLASTSTVMIRPWTTQSRPICPP